MKLFEALIERSLTTSKKFTQYVRLLRDTATTVENLAKSLRHVIRVVNVHDQIIQEITKVASIPLNDADNSSLDVSLPQITKTEAEKKPN